MRISLLKLQLLNGNSQLGSSEGKDTADYKTWFPIFLFSDGYRIPGCVRAGHSHPAYNPFPVSILMALRDKVLPAGFAGCELLGSNSPACPSLHRCFSYGFISKPPELEKTTECF